MQERTSLEDSLSGIGKVERELSDNVEMIELGADVRAQDARAVYEDGMLRVELPLVRPEAGARAVPLTERDAGT